MGKTKKPLLLSQQNYYFVLGGGLRLIEFGLILWE